MPSTLAIYSIHCTVDRCPDTDAETEPVIDAIDDAVNAGIAAAQNVLDERLGAGAVTLDLRS